MIETRWRKVLCRTGGCAARRKSHRRADRALEASRIGSEESPVAGVGANARPFKTATLAIQRAIHQFFVLHEKSIAIRHTAPEDCLRRIDWADCVFLVCGRGSPEKNTERYADDHGRPRGRSGPRGVGSGSVLRIRADEQAVAEVQAAAGAPARGGFSCVRLHWLGGRGGQRQRSAAAPGPILTDQACNTASER